MSSSPSLTHTDDHAHSPQTGLLTHSKRLNDTATTATPFTLPLAVLSLSHRPLVIPERPSPVHNLSRWTAHSSSRSRRARGSRRLRPTTARQRRVSVRASSPLCRRGGLAGAQGGWWSCARAGRALTDSVWLPALLYRLRAVLLRLARSHPHLALLTSLLALKLLLTPFPQLRSTGRIIDESAPKRTGAPPVPRASAPSAPSGEDDAPKPQQLAGIFAGVGMPTLRKTGAPGASSLGGAGGGGECEKTGISCRFN